MCTIGLLSLAVGAAVTRPFKNIRVEFSKRFEKVVKRIETVAKESRKAYAEGI